MPFSDDQLLAELRRLIVLADPVPAPVKTAALAAFASRVREADRAAGGPISGSTTVPRPGEPGST